MKKIIVIIVMGAFISASTPQEQSFPITPMKKQVVILRVKDEVGNIMFCEEVQARTELI